MRSFLFAALFALVAFAPVKAGSDKSGGSAESCLNVPEANVQATLLIENVENLAKVESALGTSLAVSLGLDDAACVSVAGDENGFFQVQIASLNADKTASQFNELFSNGGEYDNFGKVALVNPAVEVDNSINNNKETTTTEAPATTTLPALIDVLDALVSDLKSMGAIQPSTQSLIDSLCGASTDQCIELLGFLSAITAELFGANKGESTTASSSDGISVGAVVGISIGCVAGTLLIALIALKAKTGSALPRSGRVSLSPSSSSTAALLGHRIDVRSAWSEAEI